MADMLVIGAGMVGVSTALALQARGHDVTLVDRKAPGRETSFGNAGIIQAEAAEPYALPRDLATLLRFGAGLTNDVMWRPRGVLEMAPALWSYFRNSLPAKHATTSRIYARLTSRATADHAPLIEAAGAENLMSRQGLAILYRAPAAFAAAVTDAERVHGTYGVTFRASDGLGYLREEPALTKAPAGVIVWDQSWSCASPGDLTAAYAALFSRRGGRVLTGDAGTLQQAGQGWSVLTESGATTAETAVVALGPWAPQLLKRFGYRIQMIYKRGYHGHYGMDVALRRPLLDVANGVVAAPMTSGLRISTGAALVHRGAGPDTRQLDRGLRALGEIMDIGARRDEPQWYGSRPCLPDMLPMVGRAPRHSGLWFNFGHGHQGFTLGPTTAELLAQAHEQGSEAVLGAISPAGRLR